MNYTKEELLLAQVRVYLMLAKSLQSQNYLNRAKETMELYYIHRQDRTAIMAA